MTKRKLPKNVFVTLVNGSPYYYAVFDNNRIKKYKTTKTKTKKEAEEFAVNWYKEVIVPQLKDRQSDVKVVDLILNRCTFLGKSKWDSEECGFLQLPICQTKCSGVYFILFRKKVLKVGKADGAQGLYARLYSYRSKNKKRLQGKYPDQFTATFSEKMNSPELKGKSLSFYYYEIPKIETTLEGFKVQTCMARSFEKELSIQARLQGHPMTLSGTD